MVYTVCKEDTATRLFVQNPSPGALPLDVEPPSSNCPLEVYVASICVHVNPQQVHFCCWLHYVTTQVSMGTDLLGRCHDVRSMNKASSRR